MAALNMQERYENIRLATPSHYANTSLGRIHHYCVEAVMHWNSKPGPSIIVPMPPSL
jgi:hypothetical protein